MDENKHKKELCCKELPGCQDTNSVRCARNFTHRGESMIFIGGGGGAKAYADAHARHEHEACYEVPYGRARTHLRDLDGSSRGF